MDQTLPTGRYVQVAYIVSDLEQAAMKWVRMRGAGPFFTKDYKSPEDATYRNKPANLDHISAFGQYGSIMVELIQPLGEGPSVYLDHNGHDGQGLHHFAEICPDLETAIANAEHMGYEMVCRGGTKQTPVAFVDARHELGHMIELCQDAPQLRYLYEFVAKSAEGWDGSDPIRSMTPKR